ncbi:uncharacterized protein LOC105800928 [Gossypium raimondii]|uniref:uncharacterized protein LOC105800928 n=1 Tax=Gossypium raimondii TaxID=29730 RepID=UPI00063AF0F3|nr:uncharacterized protein LOC105800928 [Gossypium raimondii]
MDSFLEFSEAANSFNRADIRTRNQDVVWSPPPPLNTTKINRDASFMGVSNVAIARSSNGDVINGIKAQTRSLNVFVTETLAIRLGFLLIYRNRWQNVIIESDSFKTIKMIHEKMRILWEVSAIIGDIVSHTSNIGSICFQHVLCTGNKVADWIVKISIGGCCLPS